MGTRNLTAVMVDGEYKVAQYGQWDGYPSGQGMTALKFLREADIDTFKSSVRKCSWISEAEHKRLWAECGADPESEYVNLTVGNRFKAKYPHLDRDAGAEILDMVAASQDGLLLDNAIGFAGDSLFCEWAYVIDLDKRTFEVYRGFNQDPVDPSERFASAQGDKGYQPIRHFVTFSLDSLPTDEEFEAACSEPDEAEA